MKYHNILPIVALALSVPPLSAQEAPAQPADTQATAPELTELREDPKITRGELPNGLKYIIRPTAEPQGRACIRLYVNVNNPAAHSLYEHCGYQQDGQACFMEKR